MRRFRFPLDPALRLRWQLEEQARVELGESQRRLEQQKTTVEEIEQRLQLHDRFRAQAQQDRLTTPVLSAADHYRAELVRARDADLEALREAHERVERAVQALQQRHVESEVLDRLRERRRAEHREQELQSEQQSLDEAAVLRWRRD